jgi:hypothetical protein
MGVISNAPHSTLSHPPSSVGSQVTHAAHAPHPDPEKKSNASRSTHSQGMGQGNPSTTSALPKKIRKVKFALPDAENNAQQVWKRKET